MTRYWIQPSDEEVSNIEYRLAQKTGDQYKLDALEGNGFVPNPGYKTISDFTEECQSLYWDKVWDYIHDVSIGKFADELVSLLGVTQYDRDDLVKFLRIMGDRNRLIDKYGKKIFTELGFEDDYNATW